jgi:uncharacterized protein (DUF362 family)/Pyruvate/2-oxoacid:ferredoxin oxidoreductase delta subunit
MTVVHLRKAEYRHQALRPIIFEMLSSAGAPAVDANTRVLLKPNFLAPAAPEKAMTTHPLVLRAVTEYILEKGARVQISDSPAMGSFAKLLKKGGYEEALAGLDISIKPFRETVVVDIGEPFGAIEVAKEAMDADVVINLAKLKTHAQMRMTLGVKNCFGCIVGLKKPEWHMRTGVDREMFARLIVCICEAVKPAYTVIDGILAMEGQGPGKRGTPKPVGILLGGCNPHAVDHAACLQVGIDPERIETQRVARKMGIYDGCLEIDGKIKPADEFHFPELASLSTGPPALDRFMRKFVIQQPSVDVQQCRLCGECWKICPANAIDHTSKGISFDTETCIRCYCCLEVCPHGAIQAKKPLAGMAFSWLSQLRK